MPYNARQMFELVNGVEDYPRFLPWCQSAKVITRTEEEVIASLEIAWKGISKSFTTRNKLFQYNKVEMSLIEGPLKRMDGQWDFVEIDEHACNVMLDLQFEFAGGFFDRFFQPVFQHIANSMVDAFCKRAVELYGHD